MSPWSTACPGWKERLLEGRSLVPDLPLFDDEAQRAVRIFRRLRLPDVPGTPTFAEAGFDWLVPVVAALFGAYDVEARRRMIQEVFLEVPKKNGKSTGAAGIMVTAMIVNRRPSAEGVLTAPTKEIADITYGQASGMIRLDEQLSKIFHPTRHQRTITDRRQELGAAKLMIKAADEDVVTGGKQTYGLIDETHVFASKASASAIFVELRGALAARPDGFLVQITTQSKDPPAGVFKAELQRARDVRDGRRELPLLPLLYELPPELAQEGGWKQRKYWHLVNPNLGRSVDEGFLERELANAEIEGRAALALFASQHFNVEIGIGLHTDRWPGADFWEAQADPSLKTLEDLIERSETIVVGIDGGGLDDLLGVTVIGRETQTRNWLSWSKAWAHGSVLERRKSEASRLADFAKDGDVGLVARLGDDIDELVDIVGQVSASGRLAEIAGKKALGFDPVGIGQIIDALVEAEIIANDEQVIGVSQGWKLAGAIKTAERKLADGTMLHAAQALMNWCVGNARLEPRGNAVLITKQVSGAGKIDPLMALFNAVALMSMNPDTSRSVYEDRELLVL